MEEREKSGSPLRRMNNGLIVIPARLASTRLPNKLLLNQTGRPLLAHVIDRCCEAVKMSNGLLREAVVACDDPTLARVAQENGVRAIITRADHTCGTTRIAEAVQILAGENSPVVGVDIRPTFVVNVQGDEPELDPEAILCVAEELLRDSICEMATLAIPMPVGTEEMRENPNAVKVILDTQGRAIYFSRLPIPYDRNPPALGEALWHHHLGIYAYRRDFLLRYSELSPCPLEKREGLEQLRALNMGATIRVGLVPASWAGKGIDTPEDYQAFVGRMAA